MVARWTGELGVGGGKREGIKKHKSLVTKTAVGK